MLFLALSNFNITIHCAWLYFNSLDARPITAQRLVLSGNCFQDRQWLEVRQPEAVSSARGPA